MKLNALSLFAGAGGLDIGVERAGFKTICSIEVDPHCVSTLKRNARGKVVWQVDIRVLDPRRVADVLGFKPGGLALLHGGPPCQPFSQIGKQKGLKDPQGLLAFEMIRFAEVLKPAAVIIEQVPRFLQSMFTGKTTIREALEERFYAIGYDMRTAMLDAIDYGVAQRRKREIVVCVHRGVSFRFPPSRLGEAANVGNAIGDLPLAVPPSNAPLAPNHVDITPERDRERISYVPEGLWLSKVPGVPAEILQNLTRKDTTKFRRLDRNLPSLTLRCGETLYHPSEDRYLTPRESARLQGFPDQHIFEGPMRRRTGIVRDLDQHRQVANAVPPPLAAAVAKNLRGALCLT